MVCTRRISQAENSSEAWEFLRSLGTGMGMFQWRDHSSHSNHFSQAQLEHLFETSVLVKSCVCLCLFVFVPIAYWCLLTQPREAVIESPQDSQLDWFILCNLHILCVVIVHVDQWFTIFHHFISLCCVFFHVSRLLLQVFCSSAYHGMDPAGPRRKFGSRFHRAWSSKTSAR